MGGAADTRQCRDEKIRHLKGEMWGTRRGRAGVLLMVGLVAAALPARQAASVNPVEALRAE
jgi:hypothetical protein